MPDFPKFPCPTKVACPCTDSPVSNYSSEAPDQPVFIGFASNWNFNRRRMGHTGGGWHGWSFCQDHSREDADLCAHRQQIGEQLNSGGGGFGSGDGPALDPVTGLPVSLYLNQTQVCSATCGDGSIFTWTVIAGAIKATSQVLADRIASSIACKNALSKKICLPAKSLSGCLGDGFSQSFLATGPTALTFAVVSGMLPPGLSLHQVASKTFVISGVPTLTGSFTFTIQATDTSGNHVQKAYSMTVMGITNLDAAPDGSVGTAYSFQLTATGGTTPYTFSINAGALPDGLTLSASGLISGTPTVEDDFSATVLLQDAAGNQCFDTVEISVTQVSLTDYWDFDVLGDPTVVNFPPISATSWAFKSETAGANKLASDVTAGPWTQTIAGKIANGVEFDSVNLSLMAALLPGWNPSTQAGFTMFGWFKVNPAGAGVIQPLSFYLDSLGGTRPEIGYNPATSRFTIISGGTALPPSTIANWFFLAYTYNNVTGAERAYFNGVLFLSGNAGVFAGPTAQSELAINGSDSTMDVDEIGFSINRIFTPAQIVALYNAGIGVTWPAVNSI